MYIKQFYSPHPVGKLERIFTYTTEMLVTQVSGKVLRSPLQYTEWNEIVLYIFKNDYYNYSFSFCFTYIDNVYLSMLN